MPEGEAKPCKAPVGASSCVRVSRWKVALSHVVECHPLPGCHADMNISLFLLFFYFFLSFLDLFKQQLQKRVRASRGKGSSTLNMVFWRGEDREGFINGGGER